MVKAFLHLICSFGRSRGFGVQSPADYAYLRYVLCESWPYYAYRRLRRVHKDANRSHHRLGRLLLRVANDLQPGKVFLFTRQDTLLFDYVLAGCRSALPSSTMSDAQLCVLDAVSWTDGVSSSEMSSRGEEGLLTPPLSVLVMTRIHSNNASEQLWRQLQEDQRTMSSYDFFQFGVIVVGHRDSPHHYLVSPLWDM